MFERELMLPVGRGTYLKQIGASAAISQFQLWFGVSAALVLSWLLTAAEGHRFDLLAEALAISAASQICLFGLIAWVSTFGSLGLAALASMLVLPLPLVLPIWLLTGSMTHPTLIAISAVVTLPAVGLLLVYVAHRRWLRADFD
jgi:hypothetical protein